MGTSIALPSTHPVRTADCLAVLKQALAATTHAGCRIQGYGQPAKKASEETVQVISSGPVAKPEPAASAFANPRQIRQALQQPKH